MSMHGNYWVFSLSAGVEVVVDGIVRTARDCYVEALRHDSGITSVWSNLGKTLAAVSEEVVVNGLRRTAEQCFVEALRLDPRNLFAWSRLGFFRTPMEPDVINGGVQSTSRA